MDMDRGECNEICDKQQNILSEFRKNLSDVLEPKYTESYLLKWLKARDFDIKKAEDIFRQSLRIREVFLLDTILTEYEIPELIVTYGFSNFLGFDKEGSPVRLLTLGNADFDGLLRSLCAFQLSLYGAYEIEKDIQRLQEENNKTGKSVDSVFYIIDLEGFRLQMVLHKHVIQGGIEILRYFQDVYPGICKAIVLINTPFHFYTAFNIIKHVLKHEIMEKITFFSSDSWKDFLLKRIDANVLPEKLGGTSDMIVNSGGIIPVERRAEPPKQLSDTDAGVKSIIIPARRAFNLYKAITKFNSVILLEFRTEDYSVQFKVLYNACDSEDDQNAPFDEGQLNEAKLGNFVTILPLTTAVSHLTTMVPNFHCRRPGTYVFRFDNTYSIFRSKKLVYRMTVIEP